LTTPRTKSLLAIFAALPLLAVAGFAVWAHQAHADRLSPHPDAAFLDAGLSQAALDRDLSSLDRRRERWPCGSIRCGMRASPAVRSAGGL